jgi:hypothetical protein
MKPKFRQVLEMAVDKGIVFGYTRAFKHTPDPSPDAIYDSISREIMNELDEWFDFEENND